MLGKLLDIKIKGELLTRFADGDEKIHTKPAKKSEQKETKEI
jgi:hypothetical protein